MVVHVDRPLRQARDRLLEDANRLPHLLHAHQIAVVDVAAGPDRHLEVVRLVVQVREVLPHVVRNAGRAQHRPGESVVHGFLG